VALPTPFAYVMLCLRLPRVMISFSVIDLVFRLSTICTLNSAIVSCRNDVLLSSCEAQGRLQRTSVIVTRQCLSICKLLLYACKCNKKAVLSQGNRAMQRTVVKPLNLLLSHLSSDLSTGSRSTNALNINSFHLPTKFSQPANLTIYTILSLYSLQVEPAPHLLSS